MTSVGGATAIMAESLTKNVKKCSSTTLDKTSSGIKDEINLKQKYVGSSCPLMEGYKIDLNTTIGMVIMIDLSIL